MEDKMTKGLRKLLDFLGCALLVVWLSISTIIALSLIASVLSFCAPAGRGFYDRLLDGWQYWYALVGAFLGAAIALLVDRFRRRRVKIIAAKALIECVHHNHRLMQDALAYFSGGGKPFFPLDPEGMNLWLTQAADIIEPTILSRINAHRYEIEHINNKFHTFSVATSVLEKGIHPFSLAAFRTREAGNLGIPGHLNIEIVKGPLLIALLETQI